MTTFNTGNPIGSTDARDLSDNAENFDTALGTIAPTWVDRLGVTRDSFEGRLAKGSFYRVGTFAAGYTLTNMRQTLEYGGHEYSWAGTFPKVVAAGKTPATSGGIGAGAWVDRTDLMLRTDLSSNVGAGLIGFKQSGASSVDRTVEAKLKEQAVNMLDFYNVVDGADYYPALTRAITAIRLNQTSSRVLLVPYTLTYWPVSQSVLFNVSDIIVLLQGDIKLTSTARQKTLIFSYDVNPQPATMLENVSVIGNGTVIDGNGSAMTFSYAHGDGSDNDSTVRFNYVRNVYVRGLHATNGPIDSFSLRQCQNWSVEKCEFSYSKEDNGFSATTEFALHVDYDWKTYGYGWVVNCVAHNNRDLGMTAYDCGGVTFKGCRSYENGGGYSYEDDFSNPNVRRYEGLFSDCVAYNNIEHAGFYIDASAVKVDDLCKSFNNTSNLTDPNNLYGHGVIVSTATDVYVGGFHKGNQKSGLAIFNGYLAGTQMDITVAGEYSSNNSHGIFARGVSSLTIKSGTRVRYNGLTLVNGEYGRGINVDNSGYGYLPGQGILLVDGAFITDNGAGAIYSDYVKNVSISDCFGINNLTTTNGIAVDINNATNATLSDNKMFSDSGSQQFGYVIEASVTNGYDINNIGNGSTGVSSNLASNIKQCVRGELIGSSTYDAPSLISGGVVVTTVTVIGAAFGDFATASLGVDVSGITIYAWVSGDNLVSVRLKNESAGTIDLASTTIRAMVIKRYAG